MPNYAELLETLKRQAHELKDSITSKMARYFTPDTNIMHDVDTWLSNMDAHWSVVSHSREAQAALHESDTMRKKTREYASNRAPWLRNMMLLSKHDTPFDAIYKSAAMIVEHASRRVDLYFITLLFFYNKRATMTIIDTDRKLQHVKGSRDYKTNACHSAIISNVEAKDKSGAIVPTGNHLPTLLNTTVELPRHVNTFDTYLEGKIQERLQSFWRRQSKEILEKVSTEADRNEPRKGLVEFLLCLINFFNNKEIVSLYWSDSSPIENKLIYIFQCIGTFYFLWSEKCHIEDYIYLQLHIFGEHTITEFEAKKFHRINTYQKISQEIAGIAVENRNWLNDFFNSNLTSDDGMSELRESDFALDVIDNLLIFQETFESAMNLLTALSEDECYEWEGPNHIQYRINEALSPLMGTISYEQKIKYIKDSLFIRPITPIAYNRIIAIIRAISKAISIACMQDIPEQYDSRVYREDTEVRWSLPQDDQQHQEYVESIIKILIQATPTLCYMDMDIGSELISIIQDLIDKNIGNILIEPTTRKLITRFLMFVPLSDFNDSNSVGIDFELVNRTFDCMSRGERIVHSHASDDDETLMIERINLFKLCASINGFVNFFSLLNVKNVFNVWSDPFQLSDIQEESKIIYDYFHGAGAWQKDWLSLPSYVCMSTREIVQLHNKIDQMICGISQLAHAIFHFGVLDYSTHPVQTNHQQADLHVITSSSTREAQSSLSAGMFSPPRKTVAAEQPLSISTHDVMPIVSSNQSRQFGPHLDVNCNIDVRGNVSYTFRLLNRENLSVLQRTRLANEMRAVFEHQHGYTESGSDIIVLILNNEAIARDLLIKLGDVLALPSCTLSLPGMPADVIGKVSREPAPSYAASSQP